MTPLRQRMLEDMQVRNLSPETQRAYVHYISGLAQFYQTGPEQLGLEEIREYQLYLVRQRRLSPESVNTFVSAAKFLYAITLEAVWPEGALPRAQRALEAARGAEPGGNHRVFPLRQHDSLSGCADDGVRGRAAHLRSGLAPGGRYRFRAHADSRAAGKGQKRPLGHALAAAAGKSAPVVALAVPGRTRAQALAGGLALCRLSARPPHERRIAADGLPGSRALRRAQQARHRCTRCATASPRTCWKTEPTRGSFRCCSATAGSRRRRVTPPSRPPRSPKPPARSIACCRPPADKQCPGRPSSWPTSFDSTARLTAGGCCCRASNCASCAPSRSAVPPRSEATPKDAASAITRVSRTTPAETDTALTIGTEKRSPYPG